MTTDVLRGMDPLDPFERAVAFAIERAQRRDREEADGQEVLLDVDHPPDSDTA